MARPKGTEMIAHTTNQRPGINHGRAEPVALPEAAGAPLAIELRHLRYFAAVADAGSFTHAAERMFVAQPTLSQQIRRLEEIIGTPLLQRRREGLQLTPAWQRAAGHLPTPCCRSWTTG